MENPTTIIIADDKDGYRKMFRDQLKAFNIETIGTAENGLVLLKLLDGVSPDVILLDLEMPVMDGMTAMQTIKEKHPESKVIILSQHNENALKIEFEKLGARGYISKDEAMVDFEQFAKIIEKICSGKKRFIKDPEQPTPILSEIQKEIIHMNGRSMNKREISMALGITVDAVTKQEKKIMKKFGLPSVKALGNYIVKAGLVFLRGLRDK